MPEQGHFSHSTEATVEFQPFPKIARLNRQCTITEKIDGTNAQVTIIPADGPMSIEGNVAIVDNFAIFAGSRSRWISPGKSTDNFGFAGWVRDNAAELVKLGEGSHFGEWWGSGIQRGYGLPKGEKRFSLFNVGRWSADAERPACCGVVPTLFEGLFHSALVQECLEDLRDGGSRAAPGFMKPEGIIVFHQAQRSLFKVTIEGDHEPKSMAAAA